MPSRRETALGCCCHSSGPSVYRIYRCSRTYLQLLLLTLQLEGIKHLQYTPRHSEKTRRQNAQPQCWSTQAQSAARLLTWQPVLSFSAENGFVIATRCCCCCCCIPLPEESRRTRPPHRARGAAHQLRCTLHHKHTGRHTRIRTASYSINQRSELRAIN